MGVPVRVQVRVGVGVRVRVCRCMGVHSLLKLDDFPQVQFVEQAPRQVNTFYLPQSKVSLKINILSKIAKYFYKNFTNGLMGQS